MCPECRRKLERRYGRGFGKNCRSGGWLQGACGLNLSERQAEPKREKEGLTRDKSSIFRKLDGDAKPGNRSSILLGSATSSPRDETTHAFRNTPLIPYESLVMHLDLLPLCFSLLPRA